MEKKTKQSSEKKEYAWGCSVTDMLTHVPSVRMAKKNEGKKCSKVMRRVSHLNTVSRVSNSTSGIHKIRWISLRKEANL